LTTLPVISDLSCEGCGYCCTYVGVPPGYGRFYFGEPTDTDWASTDGVRWQAMPDDVMAELTTYRDDVIDGRVEDRSIEVTPCLWYDPSARQCRHYEWRPQICRDFQAGGPTCRAIRKGEGIDD
jgi:uncharacterized protein